MYGLVGKALFEVTTKKPLKLLQSLNEEIAVRNVKTEDGSLFFTCLWHSEKKAERIIQMQGGKVEHKKRYGLVYLLSRYRKRTGLFVSALVLALLTGVSGLFVWNISVEGNEKIPDEEIISTLREIGFGEGSYKKGVKLDSLVNNFLMREKRISWIAVNFDGTTAHVEVREGKNPEIRQKHENVNLVASHDGIIMRADVLEGEALVQKGDVVYKGQLLVSAFVEGKDRSYLRGARGSVWANTERKIYVRVPLKYFEGSMTGKTKTKYTLSLLGKSIPLYFSEKSYALCTLRTKTVNGSVNGKIILPFKVIKNTYSSYELKEKIRSEKQALSLARKNAEETLYRLSPGFRCAAKQEDYRTEDGVLLYTCTFSGVENIAKRLEFELS